MSDQLLVAVMLCLLAGGFVFNGHPWIALFVLLVAADMVSKS